MGHVIASGYNSCSVNHVAVLGVNRKPEHIWSNRLLTPTRQGPEELTAFHEPTSSGSLLPQKSGKTMVGTPDSGLPTSELTPQSRAAQ